jgi:histidine triad (HIT) family protein
MTTDLRRRLTDAIRNAPGMGLTVTSVVDAVMAVRDEEIAALRAEMERLKHERLARAQQAELALARVRDDDCVFCQIVAGEAPATVIREWPDAIAIVPLRPVAPGHVLVIPRTHVADATVDPDVTAVTMRRAAELAVPPCNLITSAGRPATQTVFHLHIHVVPRRVGDGLALPWSVRTEPEQIADA